jgi:hypothetical protein
LISPERGMAPGPEGDIQSCRFLDAGANTTASAIVVFFMGGFSAARYAGAAAVWIRDQRAGRFGNYPARVPG